MLQNLNCSEQYYIHLILLIATANWRKIVYTIWAWAETAWNKVTNDPVVAILAFTCIFKKEIAMLLNAWFGLQLSTATTPQE
jgi:hypothetical protein